MYLCILPHLISHGARQHLIFVHHKHLGQWSAGPLPTCKSKQPQHHLLSFTGQGTHGTREEAREREVGKGKEER